MRKVGYLATISLIYILIQSCESDIVYSSINPQKDSVFVYPSKNISNFKLDSFSDNGKLFVFCKVWGALYYHQNKPTQEIHYGLSSSISNILKITTREAFNSKILKLVDSSVTSEMMLETNVVNYDSFTLLRNDWLEDTLYLSQDILLKIKNIIRLYNSRIGKNIIVSQSNIGCVEYQDCPKSNNEFPNEQERLAGLFYYWNLINYHYAYKNILDNDWDRVLYEMIPLFRKCNDFTEYKKCILQLISNLDDNHSIVHPTTLDNIFGTYVPNIRVLNINDTFIIKKIRTNRLDNSGLSVGDIILSINGIPIQKLNDSLQKYVSGANEFSKKKELNKIIFCSANEYNDLEIIRDGKTQHKTVKYYKYFEINKLERKDQKALKDVVKWYDSTAYIHIDHVFSNNIEDIISDLSSSNSLILDMRGYPNSNTTFDLLNLIVKENREFYISLYPDINHPGLIRYKRGEIPLKINNGYKYPHPIVVLVDESTQSQSEFMVMAMQLNKQVYTVGNTSNGSDGNVTDFVFPGDIAVKFSGIGILYNDFTQTQRVGVKIDSKVYNTIYSTMMNTDPWLEAAIRHLKIIK